MATRWSRRRDCGARLRGLGGCRMTGQPNARFAADTAWEHERAKPNGKAGLVSLLDIRAWADLDIAAEPRLLGDLITPSARVFLVGRTGLGKTHLAHATAAGMTTGQGFLHWRSDRASRWLIIDGEMPTALIQARAKDVLRRAGEIPHGQLTIYSTDRAEEFARLFPQLGLLEPINTDSGRDFVLRLADLIRPDGIIFDNVMSLVVGDQKDEIPWSQTLPLVTELSRRKIAQIFLDHTGHLITKRRSRSHHANGVVRRSSSNRSGRGNPQKRHSRGSRQKTGSAPKVFHRVPRCRSDRH